MADKQPCWAFQQGGRCKKGKRCQYAHVEDPDFRPTACQNFARGRCTRGDACPSSHDPEDIASLKTDPADVTRSFEVQSPPRPASQRQPCHHFARGRCNRGEACNYSHDTEDIAALKSGPPDPFCEIVESERAANQAAFKEWRYFMPRDLKTSRKLGAQMGRFCQEACKLTTSGTEVMQEVIELLAGEGGMVRVVELFDQDFESLSDSQLGRIFKLHLLPFFQAISNTTVRSSALMESRLARICQYIYGPSGQRALQLFQAVARHLSNLTLLTPDGSVDAAAIPAFEYSLGVFALVVQVNTSAQAHEGLVPIVETLAILLEPILVERPAYDLRNTHKHLVTLCSRFSIGAAAPKTHATTKSSGVNATFELEKELPGSLSPNGVRHENDHDDIRQISILPTLSEIQSGRTEYLPTADPQDWHVSGLQGLLDRNFRLLREDTVGQLRDAAKFDLERLQNPHRHADIQPKRQGARTYVYNNLRIEDIAFDVHDGLELALSFDQPTHLLGKSSNIRKDWWEGAKRMSTEALICLLSSEGSATFLIVAPPPMGTHIRDAQLKATRGRLHKPENLYNDPERAIVVARLVNSEDVRSVMDAIVGNATAQFALVEFPGVLLPAFKPTLEAMQHLSSSLDVPFKDILAPTTPADNLEEKVDIPLPAYATKPDFEFDLSCLTTDKSPLYLMPGKQLEDVVEALCSKTTLDAGQAKALVVALSQSLALVQGPPGTGKSFTGVEILRALLANRSNIENSPILCVTYTNHALDSGLLRLLDLGISQIIRIGSRSKSERLADVNLRIVVQKQEMTKTERQDRYKLTKTAEGEAKEINQIMHDLSNLYNEAKIKNFLKMYYPEHHDQLFETDEVDDGFTTVNYHGDGSIANWLRSGRDHATEPRHFDDLQEVRVKDMTSTERRRLYAAWIMELKDQLLDRLATALESYSDVRAKMNLTRTEADLRVLRQANIIGVTTSGLARNLDLLKRANIKILVCEEAGEVLEAHAITALLPSIEHAILIGDHQQLRPHTQNFELSTESRRGNQYALDVSLFERLVQPNNVLAQPLPFSTLDVQRRMHPSVSQLIRKTIYPGLIDAAPVSEYPQVAGMKHRLFWMNHQFAENEGDDVHSTSHTNDFEVDMTAALVSHLVKQGVYAAGDIAVLTPYLGQLRKIRKKLANTFEILINDRDQDELIKEGEEDGGAAESAERPQVSRGALLSALRVATVDNFQGEEAKVIIISLVRSNKNSNPGFLRTTNRINVLLSRAKHGMYVLGNTETMQGVKMWADVIGLLQDDGLVGESLELACARHPETALRASNPDDFVLASPEGGCSQMCELPLQCGHQCSSACHSDSQHRAVFCMNQCDRLMPCGKHKCPKRCGESPCPTLCQEIVAVENWSPTGCEHVMTSMPCHQYEDPSTIVCRVVVKKTAEACGHVVEVPCHVDVDDEDFKCSAVCGAMRDDCEHHCLNRCYECHTTKEDEDGDTVFEVDHGRCKSKCSRAYMSCRHEDTGDCHGTESCPPCRSACDTRCPHSACNRPCWAPCLPCVKPDCDVPGCESAGCCSTPCDNVPTSSRCEEMMACGCRCPSVTGEKCPGREFCQKHGHDANLSQLADHIDGREYGDVDLDQDPCIFTSCGHIFTTESLDSRIGMSQHFDFDPATGDCTKAKTSAEPFSTDAVKLCPACRGPLQGLSRYSRITKRAALDENTKKFVVWSATQHLDLTEQIVKEQERLLNDVDSVRKPNQDVQLGGPLKDQLNGVKRLKTSVRYLGAFKACRNIEEFLQKLREDEARCSKFKDLTETARHNKQRSETKHLDPHFPEPQLREYTQGLCLLIRGEMVIFQDIVNMHIKTPASDNKGTLTINFTANRERCDSLIKAAIELVSMRQEAEGHVFWSRYAAIELGSLQGATDQKKPITAEKVEDLKAAALTHLDEAEKVCARLPEGNGYLEDEIAEVKRMLDEGTSASEMRMVIAQTAKEVASPTDKWYMCANAHPFSVKRGTPKQLARCRVCGAGVFVPEPFAIKAVTNGATGEVTNGATDGLTNGATDGLINGTTDGLTNGATEVDGPATDEMTNGTAEVDDLAARFGKLRGLKD